MPGSSRPVPRWPARPAPLAFAPLAFLTLLALPLAGCLGGDGNGDGEGDDGEGGNGAENGDGGEGTGPAPAPPEPVLIEESGDLSQGFSGNWTWDVAPGHSRFTVELRLSGPGGAPQFVAQGYSFSLEGDGDRHHYRNDGGAGGGLSSQSSACMVCEEGSLFPGHWVLAFEAEPAVAEYSLRIEASYPAA